MPEHPGQSAIEEACASVIAYLRVSTSEQVDSGAGLAAQRAAIEQECGRRDWFLMQTFEDAGVSGRSRDGREGLAEALAEVRLSPGAIRELTKYASRSRASNRR